VARAAHALAQAAGVTQGAAIHLIKRIPIAAGLGGGSSDAAAALRGLNELWSLKAPQPLLLVQLGAALGADVPFFLQDEPFAAGRGRGDVCEPIRSELTLTQVVVVPPERLATKDVFEGFDRSAGDLRLTPRKPFSTMIRHALSNGSLSELAEGLWNDLEPEAIRRCPVISTIRHDLLSLGCLAARMTGSGSAVYGLCADMPSAREISERLSRIDHARLWRIEIVHTERQTSTSRLTIHRT
jgi:4-diphosphocytidyl-2-C-methyl-D-erythritol kinase